jgi:hypothetical protein
MNINSAVSGVHLSTSVAKIFVVIAPKIDPIHSFVRVCANYFPQLAVKP